MMAEDLDDLLHPRARVTNDELAKMPPSLTPAEALPWARISRPAFYRLIKAGLVPHRRLGRAIRIPTHAYLSSLGVLEEAGRDSGRGSTNDLSTVE